MRVVVECFECILGSLSLRTLVATQGSHVFIDLTSNFLIHHFLVGAPYFSEVLVLKLEHVHSGNCQVELIFAILLLHGLFDNFVSLFISNSLDLIPIGDAFLD